MKKIIYLSLFTLVLLFSSCETFVVRSSSDAFRTGKVLDEGQYKVATNSILLLSVPMPGLIWRVSRGLPYDLEATVGWGVHALTVESGDEDSEDDTYQGPELFITKNLVNLDDHFYLAATLGTEVNILPVVDAAVIGGLDFGWYPVNWFVVFGHAKAFYQTKGYFAPQAGFGLGIDGPFVLKAAVYTHFKDSSIELSDNSIFWPYYYGLQVGFKI